MSIEQEKAPVVIGGFHARGAISGVIPRPEKTDYTRQIVLRTSNEVERLDSDTVKAFTGAANHAISARVTLEFEPRCEVDSSACKFRLSSWGDSPPALTR